MNSEAGKNLIHPAMVQTLKILFSIKSGGRTCNTAKWCSVVQEGMDVTHFKI
jgi:hypothetical protein